MGLKKEIFRKILELLPSDLEITGISLEGPDIVVYTKKPKMFLENENNVKLLASTFKKKIQVRPDPSLRKEPDEVVEIIKQTVPEEAEIKSVKFDPTFGEVWLEVDKPGLVIGKKGTTIRELIERTGWALRLFRAPSIECDILPKIRITLLKTREEQKTFLTKISKKIFAPLEKGTEWIRFNALGGFFEVGRSATLIQTNNTNLLIDCGIDVAANRPEEMFPLFKYMGISINEIDAIIITHAHLDHMGALPYLFSLGYDGPVYCTPPTRDLMVLLQLDYMDVYYMEHGEKPFDKKDVRKVLTHCITREYGETTDVNQEIRFTFYNAGHILGSAMVHLHIGEGDHNIVYSGDFKFGPTRLFDPATYQFPRVETLFMETTYGGKGDIQPPRHQAELALMEAIKKCIERRGKVLIPVFAVGRAQEIMLVLEDHFKREGIDVPVYLDGMVTEASAIHTAYPEYLRRGLQARILRDDSPFENEMFVKVVPKRREEIYEQGPCVILAPSGSLTGGPSVEHLKKLAEDERNSLIFVGYQFERSLGRKIQNGAREIPIVGENGKLKTLNIEMEVVTAEGFSGHSGRNQLVAYVNKVVPRPSRVVLMHGEPKKTCEFAALVQRMLRVKIITPQVLESYRLK